MTTKAEKRAKRERAAKLEALREHAKAHVLQATRNSGGDWRDMAQSCEEQADNGDSMFLDAANRISDLRHKLVVSAVVKHNTQPGEDWKVLMRIGALLEEAEQLASARQAEYSALLGGVYAAMDQRHDEDRERTRERAGQGA